MFTPSPMLLGMVLAVVLPTVCGMSCSEITRADHGLCGRSVIDCSLSFREYTGSDPVWRGIRRRLSAVVVRLRRAWILPLLRQRADRPVPLPRLHLRQGRVVRIHAHRVAML